MTHSEVVFNLILIAAGLACGNVTALNIAPLSPAAADSPTLLPQARISAAQANHCNPQSPNRENRIWRQNL
jgi:hypothetical protein